MDLGYPMGSGKEFLENISNLFDLLLPTDWRPLEVWVNAAQMTSDFRKEEGPGVVSAVPWLGEETCESNYNNGLIVTIIM